MDLFVLPTAGGAPISLYKSPYDEGAPRWSPDSKWIAFTSFKEGRAGIFLVSPLGGPAQKLVDLPQREPESDALVALGKQPWSPDGRWLLFARAGEKGGAALWRIDLEGRQEKELLPAVEGQSFAEPSLAPDGRRIVFTRASIDGQASLWLLDLDGSEPRPLLAEKANAMEPLFSPGGEAVIFVSDRAGSEGNVWTIDLASRRIAPVTLSPTLVGSPVVARDGRLAVATSSHQTDLYLDAVDGSSQRRLTFHTHDNFGPRLSPDGRKIAYMSNRTGDPEIWLLDVESGEERRLTDNPARDMSPTWAPDGRSILFSSDRDPAHPLWTLEIDGGRIEPVGKGVAALDKLRPVWGQWAPDGSRLGLVVADDSRNGSLWTLARDGKLSGPFLPGLRELDFYRDGRTILYVRDGKEGEGLELRAADLENGADELLYRGWVRELDRLPGRPAGLLHSGREPHQPEPLRPRARAPPTPGRAAAGTRSAARRDRRQGTLACPQRQPLGRRQARRVHARHRHRRRLRRQRALRRAEARRFDDGSRFPPRSATRRPRRAAALRGGSSPRSHRPRHGRPRRTTGRCGRPG